MLNPLNIKDKKVQTAIFFSAAITGILIDMIPSPMDALYFFQSQQWKEQLNDQKITPKQYWLRESFAYYTYDAMWWIVLFGTSYLLGKDLKQRFHFVLGFMGVGAVFAVISKNIQKDNQKLAEMKKFMEQQVQNKTI